MAATVDALRLTIGIQELLEAGLHFGHQTKRWNPKMKRYIFEERNGIYIIDLTQSVDKLREAQRFVYETVARGRKILFVGTKKQAQAPLRELATRLGQPFMTNRWLGGTLTNNRTIRQSVARLRELQKLDTAEGEQAISSKKELARLRRERAKLEFNLSGIVDMDQMPGALFVVDINRESNAVKEANRMNIPVIAIVDTNCDPDHVDYLIPGNDDAIRAIRIVSDVLGEAVELAGREYAQLADAENKRMAAQAAETAARAKAVAADRVNREALTRKAEQKDKAAAVGKAVETPPPEPAESTAVAEPQL